MTRERKKERMEKHETKLLIKRVGEKEKVWKNEIRKPRKIENIPKEISRVMTKKKTRKVFFFIKTLKRY